VGFATRWCGPTRRRSCSFSDRRHRRQRCRQRWWCYRTTATSKGVLDTGGTRGAEKNVGGESFSNGSSLWWLFTCTCGTGTTIVCASATAAPGRRGHGHYSRDRQSQGSCIDDLLGGGSTGTCSSLTAERSRQGDCIVVPAHTSCAGTAELWIGPTCPGEVIAAFFSRSQATWSDRRSKPRFVSRYGTSSAAGWTRISASKASVGHRYRTQGSPLSCEATGENDTAWRSATDVSRICGWMRWKWYREQEQLWCTVWRHGQARVRHDTCPSGSGTGSTGREAACSLQDDDGDECHRLWEF